MRIVWAFNVILAFAALILIVSALVRLLYFTLLSGELSIAVG